MKNIFYLSFLLLLAQMHVHAQWVVKHIGDDSDKFGKIKFQNDSLGYCIGNNAYFLKTKDGGENWEKQQLDSFISISDFQLMGDSTILAVGSGQLFKTNNTGISWDPVSTISNESLHSLCFFDADSGTVAGHNGIYRTINSGQTWDTVFSATQFGYKYGTVHQLYFPSVKTGYAIGTGRTPKDSSNFEEFILKSSNSGKTWEKVNSFTQKTSSIYFINDTTGFVGTEEGNLYKTTNGGNNWEETQLTNNAIKSLQFISNEVGYAAGGNTFYTTCHTFHSFFIAKTVDGGVSWASYDSTGIGLNSVYFINEKTGFVAGDFDLIMKTEGGINSLPNNYPWELINDTGTELPASPQSGFNIYPNPTKRFINIQRLTPDNKIDKLQLLNTSGQVLTIEKTNINQQNIQIDLAGFTPGLYFLRIESLGKNRVWKIVKE